MRQILFLCMFFVLSVGIVSAATIYGNLYDLSLNKASDAVITINTEPQQQYVSKNGSYAFNVPVGNYEIKAEQLFDSLVISYVIENINVKDDGSYVLDLILFPNLDEEIELGEDISVEIDDDYFKEEKNYFFVYLVIILIIMIILLINYYKKKKKKISEKKESNDLDQIIKIIKEEGGRTTQKEIRKKIPLSEAKISLMIAELEHKGKVEKIKKGRGNIIILKK